MTYWQPLYLVGSLSHMDKIFESRRIPHSNTPSHLARPESELSIEYTYLGITRSVDEYLGRNPATGILIAKGDTILLERYQYSRNDRHRFTSMSIAKTITAMLVGIAVEEGRIRSIDDAAELYAPALKGTKYGQTSIRHLLQMSSGVAFIEEYTGNDDVATLISNTFLQLGPGGFDAVTRFNRRSAEPGVRFHYSSAETQVLGLVLRSAIGRPVADYLREKIWEPIGAEADASWLIDRSGQEAVYCCFNAVLRDYGRLGLLLAHDGNWRGQQIIPRQWLIDATTLKPDQRHLAPGVARPFWGYGFQTWIFPGQRRIFALIGVYGQVLFVDPVSKLVMVHTAVRENARDPGAAETIALWWALVRKLAN